MPTTDEQFHALMLEVINGSESAAKTLFDNYGPYLMMAIRQRLHKQLRPKFDSCDIAQDVWASFFADDPGTRVFETPQHLMSYLTTLARNKVADVTRRKLMTKKRNVNREQSLDDSHRIDKNNVPGPVPTPSQIVMKQEEWGEFLRTVPPVYRHILNLVREGKNGREIADETGLHYRMVLRIIERYLPGSGS